MRIERITQRETLRKSIYNTLGNATKVVYSVLRTITYGGGNMPKYTQEIKDKALQMAESGVSLKEIQRQLGPNPKAVQRYFKKAGKDYQAFVLKQKAIKEAQKAKEAPVKKAEAPKVSKK
jgi:hypothetical protein